MTTKSRDATRCYSEHFSVIVFTFSCSHGTEIPRGKGFTFSMDRKATLLKEAIIKRIPSGREAVFDRRVHLAGIYPQGVY